MKKENFIHKSKGFCKRSIAALSIYVLGVQASFAKKLPELAIENGGAVQNDPLATIKNIFLSIGGVIIGGLMLVAFLVCIKNSINAFEEWQKGKKTFFDFSMLLVVAVGLLIGLAYLGNMAISQFNLHV